MTRTGALLKQWGIWCAGDTKADGKSYARLMRGNEVKEAYRHHGHVGKSGLWKCGECAPAIWSPYEASEFPVEMFCERVVVCWLGDIHELDYKYGYGRLSGWFGADRFIDLCVAVAKDYGIGPLADSGADGPKDGVGVCPEASVGRIA